MEAIGQHQMAAFLPFIALGMPARYLRLADVRTASPYYRLAAAFGGLAMVLLGWAGRLADGRAGVRFRCARMDCLCRRCAGGRASRVRRSHPTSDPLRFAEMARYSAVHRPALADLSPDQVAADHLRAGRQCRRANRPRAEVAPEARALCAAPSGRLHHLHRGHMGRGGVPRPAQRRAGGDGRRSRAASARRGGGQYRVLWRYLPDRNGAETILEDEDEE